MNDIFMRTANLKYTFCLSVTKHDWVHLSYTLKLIGFVADSWTFLYRKITPFQAIQDLIFFVITVSCQKYDMPLLDVKWF